MCAHNMKAGGVNKYSKRLWNSTKFGGDTGHLCFMSLCNEARANNQSTGYILVSCFTVEQSLLPVWLCQLTSMEEGSYWENGCAWHQLRTLCKNLGRQGWRDYSCFWTWSSCCSHCPTVLLWTYAQSILLDCLG